ncbi:hypothetical protein ACLMJK_009604 [Lecanora helva]
MAPKFSRICFASNKGLIPKIVEDLVKSNDLLANAISKNPRNGTLNQPLPPSISENGFPPSGALGLATFTTKLWKSERELKVHFLSGTTWQHDKVKTIAPLSSQHANIKFDFEGSGQPDILVDFNPGRGSWSRLGIDSSYFASQNQPTMNLGRVTESKTEAEIRQVILHEFGHALGAVHEHTSPSASIPWNKEQGAADVPSTLFDMASIMLYSYPTSWTADKKGTPNNKNWFEKDKAYIAFRYPKYEYDAGQSNTTQSSSTTFVDGRAHSWKKSDTPLALVSGVNSLGVQAGSDIRVRARTKDIQDDHFTPSLETWEDNTLLAANMIWSEAPRFPYMQSGFSDTQDVRPSHLPRAKTSKRIEFESKFQATPIRAKVYPSNVDPQGFTINFTTWQDSILFAGEASWLAYPSDQVKVASSRFFTDEMSTNKLRGQPVTQDWHVNFFKTPKFFMAFDELNYENRKDLKGRISVSNINTTSVLWYLQSWGDSVMLSCGASFFAWE